MHRLASPCTVSGREVSVVVSKYYCLIVYDKFLIRISIFKIGDPSTGVQAILCDELYFTYSFLGRVVNLIRANELQKAMNLVLNARLKSSPKFSFDKNRHNLYRDLIFLTNMALGPGKLCMGKLQDQHLINIILI